MMEWSLIAERGVIYLFFLASHVYRYSNIN